MIIAAQCSFAGGVKAVKTRFPKLLDEVYEAIHFVDARQHKTKVSKEKTMPGQMLYSPNLLNVAFKDYLYPRGWQSIRVGCDYATTHYLNNYKIRRPNRGAFREMDFVKEKLGVEVQFGKYSFMVYNVAAKMTIFRNLKYIQCGIEIVPVKAFAEDMSSGVSYFEQFVWDLETRGVSNIDIPVMILGIDVDSSHEPPPSKVREKPATDFLFPSSPRKPQK
jgi:hypothetical protein